MNEVITQWIVSISACRLVIILGRATFTVPKLRPWVRMPSSRANVTHHLYDERSGENNEDFEPVSADDACT
jgi:hypothetical protein